ncbi:MAG TPA: class III signal peptide-containing protein, partial [Candidatus Micrarchaeota archaeon]|nr:class III signal peptide-containing protein [Candidatus Micrarchaeota archaeon]
MGKNTARARSRAPRGQAAVEYLILISIVLVVALLAANSALNISGSIGNLVSPKSSTYWQDAQISILASSFSADGSASLLLKNRKPFS